jgi:hypothetical protein
MNIEKYLKIVLGLLVIVIGIYSYTLTWFGGYPWWHDLLRLAKGGVGIAIIFMGLLVATIGAMD